MDITERKLIDEAQRSSELRYRRLFESAKDGILIINADTGQIVDVYLYLIDMLGFSKEELNKRTKRLPVVISRRQVRKKISSGAIAWEQIAMHGSRWISSGFWKRRTNWDFIGWA